MQSPTGSGPARWSVLSSEFELGEGKERYKRVNFTHAGVVRVTHVELMPEDGRLEIERVTGNAVILPAFAKKHALLDNQPIDVAVRFLGSTGVVAVRVRIRGIVMVEEPR